MYSYISSSLILCHFKDRYLWKGDKVPDTSPGQDGVDTHGFSSAFHFSDVLWIHKVHFQYTFFPPDISTLHFIFSMGSGILNIEKDKTSSRNILPKLFISKFEALLHVHSNHNLYILTTL